ncbi:hypothetical protein BaRGS_00021826 [Batillaria attramentaria]|uniref:Uncharacterized protein n=1 Tax=Batillaria attramentaria TaxID=370345 RepID=A0ABD0KI58_9CAEN
MGTAPPHVQKREEEFQRGREARRKRKRKEDPSSKAIAVTPTLSRGTRELRVQILVIWYRGHGHPGCFLGMLVLCPVRRQGEDNSLSSVVELVQETTIAFVLSPICFTVLVSFIFLSAGRPGCLPCQLSSLFRPSVDIDKTLNIFLGRG